MSAPAPAAPALATAALLALLALAPARAGAQMVPGAPVLNFYLPVFGEFGYKAWELRGRQGLYIDARRFDVIGLSLKTFIGGRDLRLDTTIASPRATLYHRESRAEGSGPITVTGNRFRIDGSGWSWDGKRRKFVIRREIRVAFEQDFGNLLLK